MWKGGAGGRGFRGEETGARAALASLAAIFVGLILILRQEVFIITPAFREDGRGGGRKATSGTSCLCIWEGGSLGLLANLNSMLRREMLIVTMAVKWGGVEGLSGNERG